MKRKKNVDFVRKSEKTNCYSSDVNWPKLDESVSVASTYLGIGSPELATVGVSDKYFEMNVYPGLNPVANSSDFILGTSTIITSVLSANKHWLNMNESVSVANTYLGVGSPQLATVSVSDKYFNRNVYTGVNPLVTSTELIFGQNNFGTSLISDKNHWSSLDGSLTVANTYLGIEPPQFGNVVASDKCFNMNVYPRVNPLVNSTDFILRQSTNGISVLSANKHWLNLDESVSVANTNLRIGSPELATVRVSDKYFNLNAYSRVVPVANSTDFILGLNNFRTSLLSDENHWSNLDGSLAVANNYLGIDSPHLATFGISDKYINKNVYTGVNSLASSTDFILRQSNFRTSLLSDKNHWSNLDRSLSVANNYLRIDSPHLSTLGISDRFINKNVYIGVNSLASSTDFILGQNNFRTCLLSDKNGWSSLVGSKSLGSDLKFVENSNIGHLDWHLGINNISINSNSAIKEYDVINIGTDYLKRENKDIESFLRKEIQKVAEILKIEPDHIGYEIAETSKKVNVNIYFVFTGTFHDNNLQIGDKKITILNYGK